MFGFVADLLQKHELTGNHLSFSKVLRWCQRCWGTSKEPLILGTKRTRQDYLETAECLKAFSGRLTIIYYDTFQHHV
jgi:hypothetical protein